MIIIIHFLYSILQYENQIKVSNAHLISGKPSLFSNCLKFNENLLCKLKMKVHTVWTLKICIYFIANTLYYFIFLQRFTVKVFRTNVYTLKCVGLCKFNIVQMYSNMLDFLYLGHFRMVGAHWFGQMRRIGMETSLVGIPVN